MIRRLLILATAGVLGVLGALAYNNASWWPTSRELYMERFDRATRLGTDWIVTSPEDTTKPEWNNSALLYMVADMAGLSGDERLRKIAANFLENPRFGSDSVWRRMLDPTAHVTLPTARQLAAFEDYQRWFIYAIAAREAKMSDEERAALFAPDRFSRGSLTHQLLALLLYRNRVERTPALDALIDHLCERIALEAHWDMRVTDLYVQRVAIIVAAGRPDLAKRRWVERVIASQTDGGGWVSSWHGWGPRMLEFSFPRTVPNSHTTIQGTWLLYMLKYRYPDWIDRQAW